MSYGFLKTKVECDTAENEWSVGVCPTCVGSVGVGGEAAAQSLSSQRGYSSTVRRSLISLYPCLCLYLSLSLSLSPSFSPPPPFSLSLSLSLIVSPHISLSLSPAASRFLLPLLLFSPPTSPCMERRLTASPPLSLSPSIFLSPASRWLRKLGNLFADKVINTTLASFNIHHSALCFLTRSVRRERRRCAE